jgi:hypothetical protein
MTEVAAVPLDEVQWNNPDAIAFYGGIKSSNGKQFFPALFNPLNWQE